MTSGHLVLRNIMKCPGTEGIAGRKVVRMLDDERGPVQHRETNR
jgi:hypothetical protein